MIEEPSNIKRAIQTLHNPLLPLLILGNHLALLGQFPVSIVFQLESFADYIIRKTGVKKRANAAFEGVLVEIDHEMVSMRFYACGTNWKDIRDLHEAGISLLCLFIARYEEVEL